MSLEKINDKVTVETFPPDTPDHAALEAKRQDSATSKAAAERRAAHVRALETERDYLEHQPKPNKDRLAQVAEQLDAYAEKPAGRTLQTAEGGGRPPRKTAARKAATPRKTAARKAATPRKAPAKKAAAAKKAEPAPAPAGDNE